MEHRADDASGDSASAAAASHSSAAASSHAAAAAVAPSRRVRVYNLQPSGTWSDLGIGWLYMGGEVPVQANDSDHVSHLIIQEDVTKDSDHAPVSSVTGLPSLTDSTLLSVHIPHTSSWGKQDQTILTFTMPFDASNQRAHDLHWKRANSGQQVPASSPPLMTDTIDIALSFKVESDAVHVWEYVHTFPEVRLQELEDSERQAQEEADSPEDDVLEDGEEASAAGGGYAGGRTLSIGIAQGTTSALREQQSSPRTMSLLSEEQMDDTPVQPIAHISRSRWSEMLEDDDMDELTDTTPEQNHMTSSSGGSPGQDPRFFSNSDRPPPGFFSGASLQPSSADSSLRYLLGTDLDDDEEDENGDHVVNFRAGNSFSIGRKGSDSRRPTQRRPSEPPQTPSESESEVDEDDIVFPRSIRLPSMVNMEKIVDHLTSLMHPSLIGGPYLSGTASRLVTGGNGRPRQVKHKAMQQASMTPFRRRQVLMAEITEKSTAYKRNLLICSAKKPVAIRAQRTPSPATNTGAAASPAVAPSAGTPVTAATASISSVPGASPPPAPVSSPSDLNWLENLSMLLRKVEEEIAWREENMVQRRIPTTERAMTTDDTAAAGPSADRSNAAAVPSLVLLTPETATLEELLRAAQQIQESVSILFSFNIQCFMTYLFDVSSVHSFYYQWYLVITAYEYEGALERRRQTLEARKVTQANTSHLWRRHRNYLDSVVLKSPFPLQMTHVLDLPSFEQAAASPESVSPSQLSTAPTKFCLLLLSSYILPYIRDTFLYSPRALDDPIQMQMNQTVVFKNLNLLMNGIIQDGDSQALSGPTTGSGMGFGGRRTNMKSKNRKSISVDDATLKWTKHVFGRIRQLIEEEERKVESVHLPLVAPDSPVAVGSAEEMTAAPPLTTADASNTTPTKPAAAASTMTMVVSPAVYTMVSRSTKDWCPLLSMSFCSSLADFLYALHHVLALTKNVNNANGVVPMQKEKLLTKLIDDGFLPCIERVLLFCKRQQQRLQDGGISTTAFSVPITRNFDGSLPPMSSSSSSSASITWMRLLCLDFLSTLQNAQPGFMRRFMETQVRHVNKLTHSSGGNLMTAALSGDEHKLSEGEVDTQERQQPQATISPLERNKYWKLEHEKCRAARRQLSSTIKSQPGSPVTGGKTSLPPIADSLLMLVFQMMADPQSYLGVRQTASSLLRLCLDPEFGGLMQIPRPFEPQFAGQNNGNNPLVALLSLGGIGSSAARQLHFDGASSEEEESPESNDLVSSVMTQFGGQRRRPPTAAQKADMEKRRLAERKQKRRDIRKRIKGRQEMIVEDTLLHLVYATDANAMVRVVELLRAASNQWTILSSANAGITPAQLQSFVQAFPPPLLIDCIEFLSFFALRHSIVFQEFVITSKVFKLLAAFFPHPQLTLAEQAKEKTRAEVLAARSAAQQAAEDHVKPPVETLSSNRLSMSPSPSPSLSPSPPPPVDASATIDVPLVFQAPRTDVPSGILCAILRFLRITLEIDAVFVQPIQSSHILLRMVELFLHNLRPNLVHSSILEVVQFIETKKVSALVGQLLHGNSYVLMSIEADARKKALKMQSRLEHQAEKAKELKPEDHGLPMQIDAAPDLAAEATAQSTQSSAPHDPSSSGILPPAFVFPILPEAPEHAGTPSSSAPLSLPFLSSAYGISRVSHLPIWPSGFKVLCSRRQRHLARASSDAATEVNGESPGQLKRRRVSDDAEEADDSPSVKRTKLHNGAGGVSYSGSEHESASPSLSEDSSDLDTSSTSTSDSEDTADAAPGRNLLFSEEEETTTTMEEEPDQDDTSRPGNYQQQRENAIAQDQFDFDHWQEPSQAEQKSSTPRSHQGDTEDVDMFAEEPSDGVDSAAELDAANRRLADLENRRKAERQEREAAEQVTNSFGVRKTTSNPFGTFVGAARSAASGLIGGILGGPKKPQTLSFNIGGTKPAPPAATALPPPTTGAQQADLPEWLTRLTGTQRDDPQPSP